MFLIKFFDKKRERADSVGFNPLNQVYVFNPALQEVCYERI